MDIRCAPSSDTYDNTFLEIYLNNGGVLTQRLNLTNGGRLDIRNLRLSNIAEYADNAAALGAGLVAGDVYRTGDTLKIVH